MSLLQELLDSASESKFDEQIKIVCDQITDEEKHDTEFQPKGSNVFLVLPIWTDMVTPHFLVLEREFPEKFIVKIMRFSTSKHITVKTMEIHEGKPETIMKKFAQLYNHFNGV